MSDGEGASDAVVCVRQCTEERKAHVVAQEARGLLGRMPKVQADAFRAVWHPRMEWLPTPAPGLATSAPSLRRTGGGGSDGTHQLFPAVVLWHVGVLATATRNPLSSRIRNPQSAFLSHSHSHPHSRPIPKT